MSETVLEQFDDGKGYQYFTPHQFRGRYNVGAGLIHYGGANIPGLAPEIKEGGEKRVARHNPDPNSRIPPNTPEARARAVGMKKLTEWVRASPCTNQQVSETSNVAYGTLTSAMCAGYVGEKAFIKLVAGCVQLGFKPSRQSVEQ